MKPETANSTAKALGMDWNRWLGASIYSIADEFDKNFMVSVGSFIIIYGAGALSHCFSVWISILAASSFRVPSTVTDVATSIVG